MQTFITASGSSTTAGGSLCSHILYFLGENVVMTKHKEL